MCDPDKLRTGLISMVTPTLRRPDEVAGLLESLAGQSLVPAELILVDGAPTEDKATAELVASRNGALPYTCC